ncbi:MAG: ABC transporter permease [Methylocystis sp.]|nr:ABC transporter permease [Methylocystis sp.]
MATDQIENSPKVSYQRRGDTAQFALSGDWTLIASSLVEDQAAVIVSEGRGAARAVIDVHDVARLDTAGAWLINRSRDELAHAGVDVAVEGARPEHNLLLEEAHFRRFAPPARRKGNALVDMFAELGRLVVTGFRDLHAGMGFLGEFVADVGRIFVRPWRFRGVSLVFHIERFGFHGVPIIALINVLVGGIVAQQGIFQLRRFGASSYAVDLIGILILRELGVLLTSIMLAGRSGSAITAELGSMKMREEIDALRVMGLSPIEVLVAPRVLALMVALPLLTVIADMMALFGGLLVSWVYEGISPAAFLGLLQRAIGRNTFYVGLIKAPFMAFVIGLIGAMEGLATEGSAESLGRHVTASVVKSIFMVIVLDGFFAIFFAAIDY